MMTKKEMYEKAIELAKEFEWDYDQIGLRFENRDLEIGEEVGTSRHNMDREDEREFPEFGTEEYEQMYELDGASSWHPNVWKHVLLGDLITSPDDPASKNIIAKHAYLIGGGYSNEDHDELVLDEGEAVITDAVVLYKFF